MGSIQQNEPYENYQALDKDIFDTLDIFNRTKYNISFHLKIN